MQVRFCKDALKGAQKRVREARKAAEDPVPLRALPITASPSMLKAKWTPTPLLLDALLDYNEDDSKESTFEVCVLTAATVALRSMRPCVQIGYRLVLLLAPALTGWDVVQKCWSRTF